MTASSFCPPPSVLVLLILCLARRNQKTMSYPELDGIVKETIGSTDIEGFGEKDMTQYDLKLLRVGPDGYLFSGELCDSDIFLLLFL